MPYVLDLCTLSLLTLIFPMDRIVYHVTTLGEWQKANTIGFYEAASLHTEDFIHCSTEQQVAGVLQRYFVGKTGLVKLTIDTTKLHARL